MSKKSLIAEIFEKLALEGKIEVLTDEENFKLLEHLNKNMQSFIEEDSKKEQESIEENNKDKSKNMLKYKILKPHFFYEIDNVIQEEEYLKYSTTEGIKSNLENGLIEELKEPVYILEYYDRAMICTTNRHYFSNEQMQLMEDALNNKVVSKVEYEQKINELNIYYKELEESYEDMQSKLILAYAEIEYLKKKM